MRLPRDISGDQLVGALQRIGYKQVRQSGSHVRVSFAEGTREHHVTIPRHSPVRIGTLAGILRDVEDFHRFTRDELLSRLKL